MTNSAERDGPHSDATTYLVDEHFAVMRRIQLSVTVVLDLNEIALMGAVERCQKVVTVLVAAIKARPELKQFISECGIAPAMREEINYRLAMALPDSTSDSSKQNASYA